MTDTILDDEEARLAALRRLQVLDTAPEEPFDKIVSLIRTVLNVPIATVTLVDRHRQWFKASCGLDASETPRVGSFCTHTIRQDTPLVIEDSSLDPRFADSPLVLGPPHIRSYAGIPLRTSDGFNVGSLCAISTEPRHFTPAEIAILGNFARIIVDELELRLIAQVDHLTGALTRRGFVEQVGREIARHHRYGSTASLVVLDVDRFKSINDGCGHPVGDRVLRQLAEICTTSLRPTDVLGRIGGEEFALLLPETDARAALTAAERLRAAIAAHAFDIGEDRALNVTASFGIAELMEGIDAFDAWLAITDVQLYRAKEGGRNRCEVAATISQ